MMEGTLRRDPANPRYFTDDASRAVFLTGSHMWNNLQDMGDVVLDFDAYLDMLGELGHNFIRLWAWDMLCTWNADEPVRPHPWARTGPGLAPDGGPKFDLTRFDEEHFERLRDRVAAAERLGIYVSVMMFEAWAIFTRNDTRRELHCFAGESNVNGIDILTSEADGILRDWVTLDNADVVALQEACVRRVVETVNPFDNVLYEISNEAGQHSHDWQEHFVDFIHGLEADMPKQHPVGITGGMQTLNERTFVNNADWVSPECNAVDDDDPGYRDGVRTWGSAPFDRGDKVVLLDTDHLWGIGGSAAWAWKSFCRGYNVLYMDPSNDLPWGFFRHDRWKVPPDPGLRREMGAMRAHADGMDLNAAVPHNDLSSTGYCLADPGRDYVVYQPEGGPFTVALAPGEYVVEWRDPGTGETRPADAASGGSKAEFTPPFPGDAVLRLTAKR